MLVPKYIFCFTWACGSVTLFWGERKIIAFMKRERESDKRILGPKTDSNRSIE